MTEFSCENNYRLLVIILVENSIIDILKGLKYTFELSWKGLHTVGELWKEIFKSAVSKTCWGWGSICRLGKQDLGSY